MCVAVDYTQQDRCSPHTPCHQLCSVAVWDCKLLEPLEAPSILVQTPTANPDPCVARVCPMYLGAGVQQLLERAWEGGFGEMSWMPTAQVPLSYPKKECVCSTTYVKCWRMRAHEELCYCAQ